MSDDRPAINHRDKSPRAGQFEVTEKCGEAMISPPPEPRKNPVLFGGAGLRSGWRVLLFTGLLFACIIVFGRLLGLILAPRSLRTALALSDFILFGSALVASRIMARVEKRQRPETDYGLPLRGVLGAGFWEGGLWGFLSLSALLLILHAAGSFDYGGAAIHGVALVRSALLWGGVFLLVSLAEEYIFRGYPLFTLAGGMGFWPAAFLLSIVFGAVHFGNPGESWLGLCNAGFIGLFFCFTRRRTGSLWFAVGAHAGWDWAETFFYGVPDSGQKAPGHLLSPAVHGSKWLTGGSVGPEGSVLAILVIALMFAAFHLRSRVSHAAKAQPTP